MTPTEGDVLEVQALRDHLRAHHDGYALGLKALEQHVVPACGGYGIGIHPQHWRVGKELVQLLLELLRAGADVF